MDSKNTDIEVLRAISVLFVVFFHHYYLLPAGAGSFELVFKWFFLGSGVDIFFVISGFVITRGLANSLQIAPSSTDRWRETLRFWIRRAFRIMPTAWLWLGLNLACIVMFNASGVFGRLESGLVDTLAAVANIFNFRMALLDLPFNAVSGSYWSLSLEEQFYFALPFLLLIPRRTLHWMLLIFAVVLFTIPVPHSNRSLLWACRLLPIVLGVMLALFAKSKLLRLFEPEFLGKSSLAGLASLICLPLLGASVVANSELPQRYGILALTSAALVFIASHNKNYLMPQCMFKTVLVAIGARSFSIYIVHCWAFLATREIWFRFAPSGTIFDSTWNFVFVSTASALLIVFVELNYRLVEMPLRQRGHVVSARIGRPTVLAGVGAT